MLVNLLKRRFILRIKEILQHKKRCLCGSTKEFEYEYKGYMVRRKPIVDSLNKALKVCIIGSGPAGLYTADRSQ